MSNTQTHTRTIWFGNRTGKSFFITLNENGELIGTNAPLKDAQQYLEQHTGKPAEVIKSKGSIINF